MNNREYPKTTEEFIQRTYDNVLDIIRNTNSTQETNKKFEELENLIIKKNRETVEGWNILNMKIDKIAEHLKMNMSEFRKRNF